MGRPAIGVGANGQQTDGPTVAFDNLTVTDNGNLTLGPRNADAGNAAVGGETAGQPGAIQDPAVDPEGTLSDAFAISLGTLPVADDLSGSADVESGSTYLLPAGVELTDFYAELYFTTPSLPAGGSYLVGFCFWVDVDGNCYDVYLQDNGGGDVVWAYGYYPASGSYQMIQNGSMPPGSVDPTIGATNFLSLTVYQGVAILSGNSFAADAVIPLQGTPIAGDVKLEIGFLDAGGASSAATLPISPSDFSVWDLSVGTVLAAPAVVTEPSTAPVVSAGPALPPMQGSSGVELVFEQTRTTALGHPALAAGLSGSFTQESDVYAHVGADVSLAISIRS